MSLLASLLENSNLNLNSLSFLDSPKEHLLKTPNPIFTMKQPERRQPSKSVSKMNMFNQQKIDPKTRIIHRLVHKLQMKCRKYYFQFFISLQNIKKRQLQAIQKNNIDESRITNAIQKLNQVSTIIFFKYYSNKHKQQSFKNIEQYSQCQKNISKIINPFTRLGYRNAFEQIKRQSQRKENQNIRIDILASSVKQISTSFLIYHKKSLLQDNFKKLKQIYNKCQQKKRQSFKTPSKPQIVNFSISSIEQSHKNVSRFSTPQQNSAYQAMKYKKGLMDASPVKPIKPLQLQLKKNESKLNKVQGFVKACTMCTSLDQPLQVIKSKQAQYIPSRKTQIDKLKVNESDIYDKNNIFFSQKFKINDNISSIKTSQVSYVQSQTNMFTRKTYQEISQSQYSLFTPLRQISKDQNWSNITGNSLKTSSVLADPVSYKNSLVIERQTNKNFDKQDSSFMKIKNMKNKIRQDKDSKDYISINHTIPINISSKNNKKNQLNIDIPQQVYPTYSSSSRTYTPQYQIASISSEKKNNLNKKTVKGCLNTSFIKRYAKK